MSLTIHEQSMEYVAGKPLMAVGPQIWGEPNEEQAIRNAARPEGQKLSPMWFGEMQQTIWNAGNGGHLIARGYRNAFPKLKIIRFPFNKHYWTRDAAGKLRMSDRMEEFLDECRAEKSNWQLIMDFHDGPTQKLLDAGRREQWPDSYPDVSTREKTRDAFENYLPQRQLETWDMLFEWLGDRPWLWEQVIGYEVKNEPAGGFHADKAWPGNTTHFVTQWVKMIEGIVGKITQNDPGKFILAPTWAYNGDVPTLAKTILPHYGGISALDAIRGIVGMDRLIWSIHFYMGFDISAQTQAQHDAGLVRAWGALGSDPVCATEMNINLAGQDPDRSRRDGYRHFFRARHLNWLTENVEGWPNKKKWGLSWWPGNDWAASSAIHIGSGTDLPILERRFSTAQAIQHWAVANNPDWFDGPQSGKKAWEDLPIRQFNAMFPGAARDPDLGFYRFELDGWHLLTAMDVPNRFVREDMLGWHISYGGSGTTFHDCTNLDGQRTLQVEGGDGKTVIHHQMCDYYQRNHFHLGRGGGVLRLGNGNHYVCSQGGPAIIYTAHQRPDPPEPDYGYSKRWPHASINLPYGWDNRVIIDTGARTLLYGFNPARGDRLSFKGAFATVQEMRRHMTVFDNQANLRGRDIRFDWPEDMGGGWLHMVDSGALAAQLHTWNLDLTDGWYAEGWSEPEDYTEDEFTNPIPLIPPPPSVNASTRWHDAKGRQVTVLNAAGHSVEARQFG